MTDPLISYITIGDHVIRAPKKVSGEAAADRESYKGKSGVTSGFVFA